MAKPKSCFDKSICCLCTKSVWRGFGIDALLTFFLISVMAAGCIINASVYSNPLLVGTQTETAGFYMHIVSFIATLIFTSYLGRYVSGIQNAENDDFEFKMGNCCCGYHYYYYCVLGYTSSLLYAFFTLVFFAAIAGEYNSPDSNKMFIINQYSKGIVMYYFSFIIMWFHMTVFKSFIPNVCYALNILVLINIIWNLKKK